MRYRIGHSPAHPGLASSNHVLLFTAVLSLVIGAILLRLSMYGRQRWLIFWSGSLILVSLIFLIAMLVGVA